MITLDIKSPVERLLGELKQLHYDIGQLHLVLSSTEHHYEPSGEKLSERFLHTEIANLHREIIRLQDQVQMNEECKPSNLDIDEIMTGKPVSMRDKINTVLSTLDELAKPTGMIEEDVLCQTLVQKDLMTDEEARHVVASLIKNGVIYVPKEHCVTHITG